ncbi:alpha/beta hydrolase [Microbacterium sp. NPDC056052]|uniref:alpha/beta hydrolase n=1 Tax=Microbacterium sp. NPDC056052 TaxID=3345695 RepID=UPI0035D860A4
MTAFAPADPATLPLDAAVRDWMRRVAELSSGLPRLASPDPAVRRAAGLRLSDRLAAEFADPVAPGVLIDDIALSGGAGPLRARRFRPRAAVPPFPSLLWLHGGGFVGGTIDEILNDRLGSALALRSGVQIISLEYRLAPEHPFPAPVDDAVAAFGHVRAHADRFDVDPHRLGIGGNSAGAAIATSAMLRLRDGGTRVHHQALEVLPATLQPYGRSAAEYRHGFGLDDALEVAELYRAGAPDSEASPLLAADHRDLPPALLMLAEFDPLRDGGLAYGELLRAAGVPVTVHVGAGHLHGTPGLTARWQGARDWQHVFADELARAYGTGHAVPG